MVKYDYTRLRFMIYKIEVGVLLGKEHEEYDCYNGVYDKQHAFYDENVCFELDYQQAIDYANGYVEDGVNGTYAIVSKIPYESNDVEDTMYMVNTIIGGGNVEDWVERFDREDLWGTNNIIYNIWKTRDENNPYYLGKGNGKIIKDFIVKEEK